MTDNDQIIRDFCAAWGRGDKDAIVDTFTDDAVYHNIPMEPARGKDEIRAFLDGFLGVMADSIDFEIHHQLAVGDLVLNERTDTIVMADQTVALRVMGTFELEDGKIKAWRDYFDMAQFSGDPLED